ncbi:protein enabled [Culicoides brevitarsis]|uniref:protein enabled n=1 Tax=Culicoides brevitarsis TaxID=469753 RepID=UPI00307B75A7
MCEQSIIGARASVMVYDDNQKKWIPSGTSSGLSKVQIYHHQQNNTFRVVGRKLQDHEVVINCSILKGLKYNQATATFHQWRDSKFVYGLNFSSQQDAEAFARAMMHSLEVLSGRIPAPLGPGMGYDDLDMGYRTMTREDAAIMQQNNNVIPNNVISPQTPTSTPQSPPQGHHRTNSAPPVPPPAQQVQQKPNYQQQQSQQGQIYVSTQQYNQQQQMYQGQGQNMIPPQPQIPNSQSQPNARNGPIYVPSNVSKVNQQQQMQQQPPIPQQQQQIPNPPNMFAPPPMQQQQQPSQVPQAPQAPPQPPQMMNNYGQQHVQANGGYPAQYGSQIPMPPQVPQVSSPPQAVPPPPDFGNGMTAPAPPQPPAAPMPMGGAGPPPPPPMPMGGGSKSNGMDMSSLAAQLQAAKLKKSQTLPKAAPQPTENSGSSTSSGGSGNYGTIGRTTGGMASMMDEMAKTLARRRAQVDKKEPDSNNDDSSRQRPWEKSNTLPHKLGANSNSSNSNSNNTGNGSESPKPLRKRFGSASEETILKQVNGEGFSIPSAIDLENFKADIIQEVKLEIAKAKQEIIEAIKSEFNRR